MYNSKTLFLSNNKKCKSNNKTLDPKKEGEYGYVMYMYVWNVRAWKEAIIFESDLRGRREEPDA